ncbi:MAG: hypothetical protein ACRD8Z_11155 [Nitrososphaeraceae archaeon]
MVRPKKVKVIYVRVREARPGIKPTLIMPIPREIEDKLNIKSGETFAMFIESDSSFRLVRTKARYPWVDAKY